MPAVASEALASKDVQYFYDVANASRESVFADKRFRNVLTKLDELADAGYFNMSGLSMNHITSQAAWLQRGSALIPNGLWLENEMKDSTPKDFKMRYYPSMLQDAGQPTCVVASSATGSASPPRPKTPRRPRLSSASCIRTMWPKGSPSCARCPVPPVPICLAQT